MLVTVKDRILPLIADNAGASVDAQAITDEQRLADDLEMDSLDVVQLVMEIERAFDLDIPDATSNDWRTVGDIVAGVEALIASKARQA